MDIPSEPRTKQIAPKRERRREEGPMPVGLARNWKWGRVAEPDPVGEDGARESRVLHTAELKLSMWSMKRGTATARATRRSEQECDGRGVEANGKN